MKKKILVVAPHADDETLGCGGVILKHKAVGDEVHWLIVTEMKKNASYSVQEIDERKKVIARVSKAFRFDSLIELKYECAKLDSAANAELVEDFRSILNKLKPQIILLPFSGDAHSDHKVVFDSAISACKWFRTPSLKKILCYETISETDISLDPLFPAFKPNLFVDIEKHIKEKTKIFKLYASENGKFPFPRCAETIEALAKVRGASSGYKAAEAFMILKEFID